MKIRLVGFIAGLLLAATLTGCSDGTESSQRQATPTASAQPSAFGPGSVWVANEGGDSLSVVDTTNNAVVATVAGLKHPHNVQVSRDGATVYAVSGSDLVVAIDAATYTVRAFAPTGQAPAHVIEAPSGKVYVTNANDGTVSVYKGPELTSVGEIDLGDMPHGLRAAAGGSVIVVANTMAGRLDLIDPATDQLTGSVRVGTAPAQVAVTADGRYAFSGVTNPPAVVKVDLASHTVVGSVAVPTAPVQLYLTPDEKTVLSADQGTSDKPGHTVSVIDTAAMTVRSTVDTGSGPHGVVIDPSGTRAWVTNTFDDTVSVIDLTNLSAAATIVVGEEPNGISFSSRPPVVAPAATVTLDIAAPAAETPATGHQPTNSHGH